MPKRMRHNLEKGGKNEMQKICGQERDAENVVAVMFVPYTVGSELARRLRATSKTRQDTG